VVVDGVHVAPPDPAQVTVTAWLNPLTEVTVTASGIGVPLVIGMLDWSSGVKVTVGVVEVVVVPPVLPAPLPIPVNDKDHGLLLPLVVLMIRVPLCWVPVEGV